MAAREFVRYCARRQKRWRTIRLLHKINCAARAEKQGSAMTIPHTPAYSYTFTSVTCKDVHGKTHDFPDGVYRIGIAVDSVQVMIGGSQYTIYGTEWNRMVINRNVSHNP